MYIHKKNMHREQCPVCRFVPGRVTSMADHKCVDYIGKYAHPARISFSLETPCMI